jgi:hypothetical protein
MSAAMGTNFGALSQSRQQRQLFAEAAEFGEQALGVIPRLSGVREGMSG